MRGLRAQSAERDGERHARQAPAAAAVEPRTAAFAASIRPRPGWAARVVRISPRRYSAVTDPAPRATRTSRPVKDPTRKFSTVWAGPMGGPPTTGAMSPAPVTVIRAADSVNPPRRVSL